MSVYVIEDNTIRAMLKDPRVLELLPCLQNPSKQLTSLAKGKSNCSRCTADKARITKDAINSAKSCIRALKGSQLNAFKQILGTKTIRLKVKNADGRTVQWTM